jgi:glycosyltransferase involved in cell wall biosynthesis
MKTENATTDRRTEAKGKENALSLCMIVKNEGKNLEACLQSFRPIADEIVVVDTGSKDNSVSIARNFAEKVIEIDWTDDFSSARNVSLDHAAGPWVFRADADDRLPPSQIEKIKALKRVALDRAFSFKVIQPSKVGPHAEVTEVRMFPLDDNVRFQKPIHEEIGTALAQNGYPIFTVNVEIVHTGYASDASARKKAIRNLRILLRHLKTYGDDALYVSQIGDAFSVLGASRNAVQYYRKAFENPSCAEKAPDLYRKLGLQIVQEYNKSEKFKEASFWLDRFLAIFPDSVMGHYLKGRAMERAGDYPAAISCYEKTVLSTDRLDACISVDKIAKAKATYHLGKLELGCRRVGRAKHWFLQAVEKCPDVIDPYIGLGDIFLGEGDWEAAVHWFGKALAISRTYSPIPLIGMATICSILNKTEQKNMFLKALAIHFSEDEAARSALAVLTG